MSYPEPDVTNCGGVTAFMKIARLAEAFNLPVTSHGAHDITVHLLAACPNRSYLEAHGFGLDTLYRASAGARGRQGRWRRRGPGHGISFDWKGLAKLRAGSRNALAATRAHFAGTRRAGGQRMTNGIEAA